MISISGCTLFERTDRPGAQTAVDETGCRTGGRLDRFKEYTLVVEEFNAGVVGILGAEQSATQIEVFRRLSESTIVSLQRLEDLCKKHARKELSNQDYLQALNGAESSVLLIKQIATSSSNPAVVKLAIEKGLATLDLDIDAVEQSLSELADAYASETGQLQTGVESNERLLLQMQILMDDLYRRADSLLSDLDGQREDVAQQRRELVDLVESEKVVLQAELDALSEITSELESVDQALSVRLDHSTERLRIQLDGSMGRLTDRIGVVSEAGNSRGSAIERLEDAQNAQENKLEEVGRAAIVSCELATPWYDSVLIAVGLRSSDCPRTSSNREQPKN